MVNKTTQNDSEQRWKTPSEISHVYQGAQATIVEPTPQATHKPSKRLTGKQKAFIRGLIENPKQPAYKVAEQAGYTGDNATLRSIASENLSKPNILAELAKYDDTAQNTLIEVMNYSKELGKTGTQAGASYASTARATANDILDRIHGKPKQVTENTHRSVTLNIDLTGVISSPQDSPGQI